MRGILRRQRTPVRPAAALGTAEVRRLLATCGEDRGDRRGLAGLRDRALLLTAFAGGGLVLRIRHSKTDQEGQGAEVGVTPGRQEGTCLYASVAERHPEAAVVVPPRANAVPSAAAESAPTQRDGHLQQIAEHGRMSWQNASGYNKRARVEATVNRWKQVIGDELRSHTDRRRETEVAVAVHALNRMLDLGRPISVRIA
jgi:hypothetical protein